MPERSTKKPKRSRDLNVLASEIVRVATEGETETLPVEDTRNPHAVALGKLGGKKGGPARAANLPLSKGQRFLEKLQKPGGERNPKINLYSHWQKFFPLWEAL